PSADPEEVVAEGEGLAEVGVEVGVVGVVGVVVDVGDVDGDAAVVMVGRGVDGREVVLLVEVGVVVGEEVGDGRGEGGVGVV
ncbi:hypothetical protein, partial [Kocuria rosea]|uniref:hypothetical protein n=1 Tax=Kocuria rosea TaxID=1275 RepID=UPI001643D8C7